MSVSTAKDEYGSEFAHMINNVKFFAMGADYIPEDNILSRVNNDRTRKLLTQCKAANFNCIRVWGGGLYPSDDFYDICDELGLVVWQDFMFACANYRLTKDFEENILAELKEQIRRLAHHASLGLWCGNNQMEMFAAKGEWGANDEIRVDYLKMYEDLFPKLLKEEDPDRFYWPASPSSGGGFDEPNDPDRGDVHYWDVWHGNKPFTEYRKFYFRYLSEFGFQSFPAKKTIETFIGGFNAAPKYGATPTGYYLKKYVDGSCVTTADNQTRRRHTWIVFRLGEFYLDFAEAAFNATGSANDKTFGISANDAINVLRTRADINMPKFKEDGDAWVERYERERLVELAFENHRFWDVRRWKKGAQYFKTIQVATIDSNLNLTRSTVTRQWDDKYYFYPIPQSELKKNPNLTQNPGW